MNNCSKCGEESFKKIYEEEYSGVKSADGRDETVREVFKCQSCGAEGRRFTDGVDGAVTETGALR